MLIANRIEANRTTSDAIAYLAIQRCREADRLVSLDHRLRERQGFNNHALSLSRT